MIIIDEKTILDSHQNALEQAFKPQIYLAPSFEISKASHAGRNVTIYYANLARCQGEIAGLNEAIRFLRDKDVKAHILDLIAIKEIHLREYYTYPPEKVYPPKNSQTDEGNKN